MMSETPVPIFTQQRAPRLQNPVSQVYQRQTHCDEPLVVHVSEAAGVGCHVAQNDVRPAAGEQLLQLGACGRIHDIMTRHKVGTVERRDVQQIDANNRATWHVLF